jgi:hypothetical protein
MLKMAIKSDNGYVYFNELLYRCMRRKYGNHKINKKMQIFEELTRYRIYLMTLEIQQKGHLQVSNDDIKHALVKKENCVNPFLTVMNFRITFRAWSKQARRRIAQLEDAEAKAAVVAVEIDVENIYSATSEEDEVGDADKLPISRSRSGAGLISMSGSHGSNSARASRKRSLRSKDHLAQFQKKMTLKLRESLVVERLKSSNKKGNPAAEKELKASMLRSITKRQKALTDLSSSAKSRKSK